MEIIDLQKAPYGEALALQERLVKEVHNTPDKSFLILVEHDPPVITLGRRGTGDDVLVAEEFLASRGVELFKASRGGQVTLHCPGQLVAYPILHLDRQRRTVRKHVHNLEEAVIRTLGVFGVKGVRREGYVGVWVDDAKIAAVGVAVDRWVSYHGLAMNVSNDLSLFDLIVPCGQPKGKVTRLCDCAFKPVEIGDVKETLLDSLKRELAG